MSNTTARIQRIAWLTAAVGLALLVYLGYYLFGPGGAFSFGAFFGIALFLAASVASRWNTAAKRDRLMSVCAILTAVTGGLYVAYVDYGWGFHHTRQRMRDAAHLQRQFADDSRFQRVSISYVDPPRMKGEWLSVSGIVPSDDDLATLHAMLDDDEKWAVEWDVAVAGEQNGG